MFSNKDVCLESLLLLLVLILVLESCTSFVNTFSCRQLKVANLFILYFTLHLHVKFGQKVKYLFLLTRLLSQLSVVNPENFKEIKAREVLKFWKEKTGISPKSFT